MNLKTKYKGSVKMENSNAGWNLENTYASLPEIFYTKQRATPVNEPKIALFNEALAKELGLNPEVLKGEEGARVFSGNKTATGSIPVAQAYAGHQFGHFTMLGDGRALLIGEQITPDGKRFDIQLKGSGRTPYSRGGDGRASLGPMLREYIISEAMNALGIPTTRSLAVVVTNDVVYRETELPLAILTRVASSHIRVGTFQYVSNWSEQDHLVELCDYTINRHFPEVKDSANPYLDMLREVIKRQASLIVKWQLVGFIHGVMNTDNMSISGETIDYGPCAFMDQYDPDTVFSSIDSYGRYRYKNQPKIAAWNLARFAETLLPLLHENREEAIQLAEKEVLSFQDIYHENWLWGMRAKLGIYNAETEDESLIESLLQMMHKYNGDYTNTFLAITFSNFDNSDLFKSPEFNDWNKMWRDRLKRQSESVVDSHYLMQKSNPSVIPRNHRVEEALSAAVKQNDYSVLERLMEVLLKPYAHTHEQVEYQALPEPSECVYQTFCGT